jgi:transcription termination factor NusB
LDESKTRRRRHEEARKRKRENQSDSDEDRGGSDSSSSSSEGGDQYLEVSVEERDHTRQVLEGIGKRLATLNGQMERVLHDRDFEVMPRVATTLLKVWIMTVDVEYKACLDCEIADNRKLNHENGRSAASPDDHDRKRVRTNEHSNGEGGGEAQNEPRQNGRTRENGYSTIKSEGNDDDASVGEEADRDDDRSYQPNGTKKPGRSDSSVGDKSWSERACEDLIELFATLDVPLRGVCMSVIHVFLRGPLLDILHRGRNLATIRLLYDLVSPLSVVLSLNDIRHQLVELMSAMS